MPKMVEMFAAAILVVTMVAIVAIATGLLPSRAGSKWPPTRSAGARRTRRLIDSSHIRHAQFGKGSRRRELCAYRCASPFSRPAA